MVAKYQNALTRLSIII
jgi:hypothetical protein